jgi:hypothetical protein
MARRRMISPDIWQDPWFGKLSHTEQILFIGIISNCDDEGRILAESPYLRSRIFIYQDIDLSLIETMLSKFNDTNHNFYMYNVNGSRYIYLKTWNKYQKPEHASPSTLPPPPNQSVNDSLNQSVNDSPPSVVECSIGKVSIGKVSGNTAKERKPYGEFNNVLLTNDERGKLIERFGEHDFNYRVEKLSSGIESKGYKYKSHYATILNWARKDEEDKKNGGTRKVGSNPRAVLKPEEYTRPDQL